MGLGTMTSPDRGQSQQFPSTLANQGGPFYNPTLAEFPNHLPSFDTKVNELLMNTHHIQAAPTSSSSSCTVPSFPVNSNLDCLTPVGEVWKEEPGSDENYATLGGTTLQNFLIVAGWHNSAYDGRSQPLLAIDPVLPQPLKWGQYEMDEEKQQQQQQQQQESMTLLGSSLPMVGNANANAGFAESQQVGMPMVSAAMVRGTPSDSQMPMEMNRNDESIDKSIERRQKRMIKNRESAARSRARKQAYINKLEEEVRQLTDTNKRLKRQKEEEMLSHSHSVPQQRYQLRRTSSAPL